MEGVLYVTDDNNEKRFVQIDLQKYGGEYLDDFLEGLVAASRRDEEDIPMEAALAHLRKIG